ncbi:MAG: formylglycine-generating enzyme family protein [Anaerolineae bacterium]|nr:formylglycine-generating enzyme family protein [Anaerolineae bacterium]
MKTGLWKWIFIGLALAVLLMRCRPGADVAPPQPAAPPQKDGMELVYVPPGEFLMGSTDADIDRLLAKLCGGSDCKRDWSEEQPQHTVYLDAFWLDRREVTNAMFAEFVADSGYKTDAEKEGWSYTWNKNEGWVKTEGADWQHPYGPLSSIDGLEAHPVVQVSWNDARAYCEWAGRRLPSEAEWEKAARGAHGQVYPWGNADAFGGRVNFADRSIDVGWAEKKVDDGYQHTAPVGSYPKGASPYGALDMAGNVSEWVADWYDAGYYERSPRQNPPGAVSGEYRVLRGGDWISAAWHIRCAYRGGGSPSGASGFVGFRCALDASP